ncbi:helix-turn-helix domain-containing protein [Streptomyces sp. NPDC059389]|uniref:helix-turn-helix domain-containing protein n=1 Tax=Streptomyces sp. NPDC059389 TaxID=3346818 RepID=UPI0036A1BDE0
MTTTNQQKIPPQAAAYARRAPWRRTCDLPEPAERRRLREQWGLSTRQVAVAFGVTPATVRSWECGRATPRGSRKEAYRRFLAGLAEYGAAARADATERGRVDNRRPVPSTPRPAPRPARVVAPASAHAVAIRSTTHPPAPVAARTVQEFPVRGADPVSPERIRRLRLLGAAACVWSIALWVILTCPPGF